MPEVLSERMLGSNQSVLRAHNERLVLSLLRRKGPLAKADIARKTGLSAQTISVIMRLLEDEGMLLRDAPRRGKVGQPSVPMRLSPEGAYFHGLAVGRRWVEYVLVDMTGAIRHSARWHYGHPDFQSILDFAARTIAETEAGLPAEARGRIHGIGLAMPFRLWEWAEQLKVDPAALQDWRTRDIGAELQAHTGRPVTIQNDATSACAAELTFGTHADLPANFLHINMGFFVGGGLVIDNHIFAGASGNAGAIGSLPIPQPDGSTRQLIDVASLYLLGEKLEAAGKDREPLWQAPPDWRHIGPEVDAFLTEITPGLAQAIQATVAIMDIGCVLIDGYMPRGVRADLVWRVERAIAAADFAGLARPELREGSIGPSARSLGAASLPLAARFLI